MPIHHILASHDLVKSGFYASGWPLVIAVIALIVILGSRSRAAS